MCIRDSCQTDHTTVTIYVRNCNYKIFVITQISVNVIIYSKHQDTDYPIDNWRGNSFVGRLWVGYVGFWNCTDWVICLRQIRCEYLTNMLDDECCRWAGINAVPGCSSFSTDITVLSIECSRGVSLLFAAHRQITRCVQNLLSLLTAAGANTCIMQVNRLCTIIILYSWAPSQILHDASFLRQLSVISHIVPLLCVSNMEL